ncbi:SNF2-related protein [Pedobacter alpinus]|uniref:SNF2-related protein n=1 Tax=Pedobacter alpinus TaxID=1590643 RepID=A0ABW5TWY9_9SPHI
MSIFEQLKRDKNTYELKKFNQKDIQQIYFVLQFNQTGAYIIVSDKNGNAIDFDYRNYSGLLRSITKNIQQAKDKNNFTIDWDNPDGEIFLHEHPYLINPLLECGFFVNSDLKLIKKHQATANLTLQITSKENDVLHASFILDIEDVTKQVLKFRFITEEYALLYEENLLIETANIGVMFNQLANFNVNQLIAQDLQKYLSLVFSYIDNITLDFNNYKVNKDLQALKAKPILVFEKVDEDQALHIRVGQMLPNTDIDFLDDYDIFRFAVINDLEQTITIRPIEQIMVEKHIYEIEKLMLSHLPKGKKKHTGIVKEENRLIVPQEIAAEFIYKNIPNLLSEYTLIGSERLKQFKIYVSKPKLNVQIGHGIDFLEGSASLDFDGQQISLFDALNQYHKNKYILLADGSHALLNEAYMQKLQRLFKKKKDNVEISLFDLPLIEELIEDKIAGEHFTKAREVFEGFNELQNTKAKLPKINAKLRPYQEQGFKWLQYLYLNKLGGCLADDMGLGKTLQTITLLCHVYLKEKTKKPSLIVMPKSLLYNWENELKKFSPELSFYIWYNNNRDLEQAKQQQIIVTTYAMVRNEIEM